MNLKPYYDAAQRDETAVAEVASQIDTLFNSGKPDEAMGLRASLESAKAKAKGSNELYLTMRDAAGDDLDPSPAPFVPGKAPAMLKHGRGDNFGGAMKAWLKEGDAGALQNHMRGSELQIKNASNATDMNVGTPGDGGYVDPAGFYRQVIARRSEISLANRLGVMQIPGRGTTVNVPLDAEADGDFVATNEAASFDLDAPALGQKAMTLVKYTKRIVLSYELLEDEDARLMDFLANFVARGQAKTLNNLLLTEVGTNGTKFDEFASATAIAAGEPENIAFADGVSNYLDDSGSVAWVTRASTFGAISSITGNYRLYAEQDAGSRSGPTLFGHPVYYSNKVAAPASTVKSLYFGNWSYVGWREAPGFTMLRDPYSGAGTGQVILWMYFRTVFGVLQADAIGYGQQAA